MTDENHKGQNDHAKRGVSRRDRLKLKLRENLKRRKSQIMERSRSADAPSGGNQASPDGEVGKRDE
jgi:hypothetical protein